jgi:predicted DNA-binding protein
MAKQFHVRLPDELAERMDRRVEELGQSRNAWLIKIIELAVEQPIRTINREEQV